MNEEHTEESVKSKRYNVRGLKGKNKGRFLKQSSVGARNRMKRLREAK